MLTAPLTVCGFGNGVILQLQLQMWCGYRSRCRWTCLSQNPTTWLLAKQNIHRPSQGISHQPFPQTPLASNLYLLSRAYSTPPSHWLELTTVSFPPGLPYSASPFGLLHSWVSAAPPSLLESVFWASPSQPKPESAWRP